MIVLMIWGVFLALRAIDNIGALYSLREPMAMCSAHLLNVAVQAETMTASLS
jgi:hypothetical protein